jgi:DNA-binding CsgD family transcriptional regulator
MSKHPSRRWVDRETMIKRDAQIAAWRAQRPLVPFREIARRLDIALGSVTKGLRRHEERQAMLAALGTNGDNGDDDDDWDNDWRDTPLSKMTDRQHAEWDLNRCLSVLAVQPGNALELFRLPMIRARAAEYGIQ